MDEEEATKRKQGCMGRSQILKRKGIQKLLGKLCVRAGKELMGLNGAVGDQEA